MLVKDNFKLVIKEHNLKKIFKQGLVHNIYLVNKYIVKISKKEFPDFNCKKCFLLEKKSLELLRLNGIPVPKSLIVSSLMINNVRHFYLLEDFVVGKQVKWGGLNSVSISNINDIYNISHKIKVNGAGPLDYQFNGFYKTWGDFIKKSIEKCKKYLSNNPNIKIIPEIYTVLKKNYLDISKSKSLNQNVFLLVDFNPGNMFLDKVGNVISVIDIDHPMGGDYLFDYAPINWHHKSTFEKLQSRHLNLQDKEILIVFYYTLIYGLNTIVWRTKHNLSCNDDFSKLIFFYSKYIKLRAKIYKQLG